MSENLDDLIGGNPNSAPKQRGLVVQAAALSSFELEMMERSMIAMDAARAEFGRGGVVEFIEDDDPDTPAFELPAPIELEPLERELIENEDAILDSLANIWMYRVAIARATRNEKEYRAACAAEGIAPF